MKILSKSIVAFLSTGKSIDVILNKKLLTEMYEHRLHTPLSLNIRFTTENEFLDYKLIKTCAAK